MITGDPEWSHGGYNLMWGFNMQCAVAGTLEGDEMRSAHVCNQSVIGSGVAAVDA